MDNEHFVLFLVKKAALREKCARALQTANRIKGGIGNLAVEVPPPTHLAELPKSQNGEDGALVPGQLD